MRLVLCIGTAAKTLAFLISELIIALAVYVLVVRAAVHTDYEHIYIIVTEAAAVTLVAHLRQRKALNRLPVILYLSLIHILYRRQRCRQGRKLRLRLCNGKL